MDSKDSITKDQIWVIVDKISKLSITPENIVNQLPNEISGNVKKDNNPTTYLFNIVQTVIDYHWGLESLVEAIYYLAKGKREISNLDEFLYRVCPRTISMFEMAKLKIMLLQANISEAKIELLYKEYITVEQELPADELSRGFLFRVLYHLAEIGLRQRRLILLDFIALIKKRFINDARLGGKIISWCIKQADIHKIDFDPEELLKGKSEFANTHAYLLIELEPRSEDIKKKIERRRHIIKAWYLLDGNSSLTTEEQVFVKDDNKCVIGNLTEAIQQIFYKISDKLYKLSEPLKIEFFLPFYLLNYQIDQLEIDQQPLGINHQVVVRSYERVKDRRFVQYLPSWKQRGQRLSDLGAVVITRDSIVWELSAHNYNMPGLKAVLNEDKVICLTLTYAPTEIKTQNQIFEIMLTSGIPIGLWPRKNHNDPVQFKQELESLIYQSSLNNIPRDLKAKRSRAFGKIDPAFWNDLTLLWDDPKRLPAGLIYINP